MDKIVHKAMYTYAYGKPKPLHLPVITDSEYVESIIRTLTRKVMGKIENLASPQETKTLINVDYSKPSRLLRPGSMAIPSAPSSCKDETKKTYSLIKLMPYSTGFNEIVSQMVGTEQISTIKSKCVGARSKISIDKNVKYGIGLPADHKDYWKYKKIYDSIVN